MKTDEEKEKTKVARRMGDGNETWFCICPRRTRRDGERERGVQHVTAVVTMANAAWCDVNLAAEQS